MSWFTRSTDPSVSPPENQGEAGRGGGGGGGGGIRASNTPAARSRALASPIPGSPPPANLQLQVPPGKGHVTRSHWIVKLSVLFLFCRVQISSL